MWFHDFTDGIRYLKGERGLRNIYTYDAVTNGASQVYGPILVAFFRTAPGYSVQLYAFFRRRSLSGEQSADRYVTTGICCRKSGEGLSILCSSFKM